MTIIKQSIKQYNSFLLFSLLYDAGGPGFKHEKHVFCHWATSQPKWASHFSQLWRVDPLQPSLAIHLKLFLLTGEYSDLNGQTLNKYVYIFQNLVNGLFYPKEILVCASGSETIWASKSAGLFIVQLIGRSYYAKDSQARALSQRFWYLTTDMQYKFHLPKQWLRIWLLVPWEAKHQITEVSEHLHWEGLEAVWGSILPMSDICLCL